MEKIKKSEEVTELKSQKSEEVVELKSRTTKTPNETTRIYEYPEEEIEEIDTRTFCQKTFGKMGPGSLRGCIFNLCILSLGTGCLALPQKIGYMSIFWSPVVVIISGIINHWTLNILGDAYKKYKINKYEELVTKLYNEKFTLFLSIIIIFNQIGMVILYQVILYKLLGGIINEIFKLGFKNVETFADESFWSELKIRFIVCYSIMIFVLFPLCKLKTISKMRYASTFGILSLMSLILIVVLESPFFIKKNIIDDKQPINFYDTKPGFGKYMEFLKSIATILYAFSCHPGVFPVLESLYNPTKKRIKKVFRRAILLDIICYLIIGIFGYLSQPLNTPDLIVERNKIFKNDIVMNFGQLLFIFCLIAKICANYNALRSTLLIMFKYDPGNYPDKVNLIITTTSLIISTFIAVVFQKISDYISLIGSFCSVWIAVLFPCLIYIKTNGKNITHWINIMVIFFFIFAMCFGLTASYYTVLGIIDHKIKKIK